MTSKHTPGPWRLDGEGLKAMVRGDDATIVCLRHRLPGIVNAENMRLIAAAPELLAACEAAYDAYDMGGGLARDVAEQLLAAIKKARGK